MIVAFPRGSGGGEEQEEGIEGGRFPGRRFARTNTWEETIWNACESVVILRNLQVLATVILVTPCLYHEDGLA